MRSKVVAVATVVLAMVATVGVTAASASVSSRAAARQPGPDRAAPAIPVAGITYEVAVDQATHTAYVGNGNTMSVINIATCNAMVTSGCGQTPPSVAVGPGPVDAAVDQATDTIYVVALGSDTVSVIDGATRKDTVGNGW
jgi:DNA-binding beta-propeller fold protein YncE